MNYLPKTGTTLILAALSLASCESTPTNVSTSPAVMPEANMHMASASDEATCVNAVGSQTNNSAVVISSTSSEANNIVIVGVGPQMARWKCLINKGKVVEVMSLTDEGAL